jgi:hypothetical protein
MTTQINIIAPFIHPDKRVQIIGRYKNGVEFSICDDVPLAQTLMAHTWDDCDITIREVDTIHASDCGTDNPSALPAAECNCAERELELVA